MKAKNTNSDKAARKKSSQLMLGVNQDISVINKLHERLKKCADKKLDVNLNASRVESIDTSTLQLLLSFIRQIQQNGNNVNWQSPSEVLLYTANLTGLKEQLLLSEAT